MQGRNRIVSVLLCIPIMLSAISFEAPASALPAFAIPADTTIADVILGMLTSTGSLPINTSWLNSLESAFGSTLGTIEDFVSSGLITETNGTFFDSGLASVIENMPEYASLGLDDLFSVGAEEATAAGVSAMSGGAFLSGQTLLGMNIGAMGIGAGVLGGVGLGMIAAHFIMHWGEIMENEAPLTTPEIVLQNLQPGGSLKLVNRPGGLVYVCLGSEWTGFAYYNASSNWYSILGGTYNRVSSKLVEVYNGHVSRTTYGPSDAWTSIAGVLGGWIECPDYATANSLRDKVLNGEIDPKIEYPKKSPDVIGPDGKTPAVYNPEDGKYTFPSIQPQINPEEEGIKPVPIRRVKELPGIIDDPSADPDAAEDAYRDLLDEYVVPITPPETDPDPGQNPYLDPDAIPEQPEYEPKQTEISETEIEEAGPYTTPNLMERFPFCIPNDILSIFSKFKAARQAPSISWRFYVEDFGIDYTFNLDLSDFDEVAELLRLLELVLFVVGLAVATRYLIGG